MLVQVSYAIGVARPINHISLQILTAVFSHVNNTTDGEIARYRPVVRSTSGKHRERLKLRNPIYQETAAYGHMGRTASDNEEILRYEGRQNQLEVETLYMGETLTT